MSILAKIAELKVEVAELSSSLSENVSQIRVMRRSQWFARLRGWYYTSALAFRKPAEQYSQWFLGVLLVGSTAVAAIAFVVLYLLGLPTIVVALGALLSALVACGCLAITMTTPATVSLPSRIAQEKTNADELRRQLTQYKSEESKLRQNIARLRGAIRELQHSEQLQRELLLQKNWQEMRGSQWQSFLAEVFRLLGAKVDSAQKADAQGVDLLVRFGDMTIAVLARGDGFEKPVNHQAVQQVIAGKSHYGCDRAAVISNSRFTKSATELAQSSSCYLIGRKEFEAFVMGSNLELLER